MSEKYGSQFEIIPIIHVGRSGSTHFERVVSRSFGMLSLGEIFNSEISMPFLEDGAGFMRRYFDGNEEGFLAHRILRGIEGSYWKNINSPGDQSGFHSNHVLFEYKPTLIAHAFHPCHSMFYMALKKFGVRKVIVLERRSVLRRILSSMVARKTMVYHSDQLPADGRLKLTPFHFDCASVVDDGINPGFAYSLKTVQDYNDSFYFKLRAEIYACGFDLLTLEYESDICRPTRELLVKVQQYLDIEPVLEGSSGIHKVLGNELHGIVSNADEVLSYCKENAVRL